MLYKMAALLVGIVALACTKSTGVPMQSPQGPVSKIAVLANGSVTIDGSPITIEALSARLADLKRQNGAVLYYREAAGTEPPPQAMEVIKLLTENRVPISLSTKPDYSDVVLPDGTTRPRGGGPRPQ